MNILICDDDQDITNYIKEVVYGFFKLHHINNRIDVFFNGEFINNSNNNYDIAILDIVMYEIDGISVAKRLTEDNPDIVFIFETAHREYLDEVMDLKAIRFIEKPIEKSKLISALEKAVEVINSRKFEFFVSDGAYYVKTRAEDVIYFECNGHHTYIKTINKKYESNKNLNYWENRFSNVFFYRIHKSFLINVKHINAYKRDAVIMDNNDIISISRRHQSDFKEYLKGKKLL